MKPFKVTGIQYAALPYRFEGRRLSVLLITSRGTRRWVIPKGWPMPGLRPQDAAAIEAVEEAGVIGQVADHPLGSYQYMKLMKGGQAMAVQVIVFPLRVDEQTLEFKETGQRRLRWLSCHDAASRVAEPGLQRLIRDFGTAQSANPVVQLFQRYRAWRFGPAA